MDKNIQNEYVPDIVTPPGETLLEVLEMRGMSQADLAERMGRPRKTINEIIKGKAAITAETALQLELVLGVPASFWNNREWHYREFLARKVEQGRLSSHVGWLQKIPVQSMIRLGWIERAGNDVQQLRSILNYFGIVSPDQWEEVWLKPDVAYRRSAAFTSDPYAVAVWLRAGEIIASELHCQPFDADKFRDTLQNIRTLTHHPIEVFKPKLTLLCAEAGVAMVFVPELPRVRVCGATRWLNSSKALIQLSLRYKTDDHLWFTFFHEAGHIVLHGKREVFIEDDQSDDPRELEANRFAANMLIPESAYRDFVRTSHTIISKAKIQAFAEAMGIASGILVGRLQHDGLVPHSHCNDLKRRFEWAKSKS